MATQTDVVNLSSEELQDRIDTLCTNSDEMPGRDTIKGLLHELQVQQIELEIKNRSLQKAQQQLEEARDRYADLYDFAPVCYITFDAKGLIQEINLTGTAMLGQERGRLIGKPFSQWLSVMDLERFFKHLKQAHQQNNVLTEELQLRLGNGQVLDVRLESVTSLQFTEDKPTYRSVIIDTSARMQAEREIIAQARQLNLITDTMPVLIAYVDQHERYQFVNKRYEEWFELPRDKIQGRTVKEVIGEDAYSVLKTFIDCALAGKPVTFDVTVPYQAQGERDINASYFPDHDVDGKVVGYFVLIRDVTDTKKLVAQDKLRLLEMAHVSRINTMGEMVAEIAHELNQPLAAISIYSDIVSRSLQKGSDDRPTMLESLNEIKLQAGRASQVLYRVREFASKKELQPDKTDINSLVNALLNLLEVEARWHEVILKLDLSQTMPMVYVDKILIEQVILNLARNAIEAMAAIEQGKRQLLIRTSLGKHNEIELQVEDSGPGLSVIDIDRVFEPFYTSKQNGMGMGLAISRSIIKAHNGRLWAVSNELGGTTFTFTLPVISQAEEILQGEM